MVNIKAGVSSLSRVSIIRGSTDYSTNLFNSLVE